MIQRKIKHNLNPKGISHKIHKIPSQYHHKHRDEIQNKSHLLKYNQLSNLSSNFMPNNFM